jgi:hypothetical protein
MTEYKHQTILGMIMAGVVGVSLVAGVMYLTPSHAPTTSTGACARQFRYPPPFGSANSKYDQTTLSNGTIVDWIQVLLMPQDSSGQLCVLYWHFQNYPNQSFQLQPFIQPSHVNGMQTPALQPTISANPSNFTLAYNETQSVTFTVQAQQGSKGIYGVYIPNLFRCSSPPLVVGYSLSEVNSSDFGNGTDYVNAGCPASAYAFYIGLSNIQVGYVPYYYTPSNNRT